MLTPIEVISRYPPHRYTLGSLLASRAAANPDREFLVYRDTRFTYSEALTRVERVAAMLAARGVRAGDRIGVMSLNHPSTVFLFLALARLGAMMVPVNPDYGVEEARYVLTHAQVSGVICAPSALATVVAACAAAEPMPWIVLNEAGEGGFPVFDDETLRARRRLAGRCRRPRLDVRFHLHLGHHRVPQGRDAQPAQRGARGRRLRASACTSSPSDRLLCILPMFHVNAIFYSLGGTLAAGATLILEPTLLGVDVLAASAATPARPRSNTIAAVMNILMRRPRAEFVPGHTLAQDLRRAVLRGDLSRVPRGVRRAAR